MRPKSILLLILALGCGLVASIGITQVMAKRDGTAPSGGETVPILVALDNIPVKAPLTPQVLKLEEWPKDKVPQGAVTKIEDVEGRRTRAPIYPGEAILESKLFEKGSSDGGISMIIPKGYRLISVKVDSVSGAGGMILPGDRVDLAVSLRADHTKGIPAATTKTFLQDIKVLAVNDQFQMDPSNDEKSITAKTVSLQVTPKQAQDIMVCSEAGKIQLVMRSPDEKEQTQVAASTLDDILNRSRKDGSSREKESPVEKPQPQPKSSLAVKFEEFLKNARTSATPAPAGALAAAAPSPQNWAVRLILGSEVKEVVLEQQADASGGKSGFPIWKSGGEPIANPGAPPAPAPTGDLGAPAPSDGPAAGQEPDPDGVPSDAS